jgi:hypothetical protein
MAPTTMSNGTSGQRNATRLRSGESRHNMIHAPKTKMQMTIHFIVGFNVAAGSPRRCRGCSYREALSWDTSRAVRLFAVPFHDRPPGKNTNYPNR